MPIPGVYQRVNAFLASFVEKRAGWAYTVRDRTALEAILDMDFGDTTVGADFLRDYSEAGFSGVFLYGQEWVQLSFDALLFAVADLLLHDFTLAAGIAFLVVGPFLALSPYLVHQSGGWRRLRGCGRCGSWAGRGASCGPRSWTPASSYDQAVSPPCPLIATPSFSQLICPMICSSFAKERHIITVVTHE